MAVYEAVTHVLARYAKTDAASLAYLRRELLRPHYTAVKMGVGAAVAVSAVGGLLQSFHPASAPYLPVLSVARLLNSDFLTDLACSCIQGGAKTREAPAVM